MPELRKLKYFAEHTKGWIIGEFANACCNGSWKEFGIKTYTKSEINPYHYHQKSKELNYIIDGYCQFTNEKGESWKCEPNDIFIIKPNEIFEFTALSNCTLAVLKSHSDPKDKYLWQPPQTQ